MRTTALEAVPQIAPRSWLLGGGGRAIYVILVKEEFI